MARRLLVLVAVLVLVSSSASGKRSKKDDNLLLVIAPSARAARAHPHVNVRVDFGNSSDGLPADPATFKARLGRSNVTSEFKPIVIGGRIVGMRAAFDRPQIKIGRHHSNRIRFFVQSIPPFGGGQGKKAPRRARDVDRIRFRAIEADNQPPIAVADALQPDNSLVIGLDFPFDASRSVDPDGDEITYAWDFGDKDSSTLVSPTHIFETESERVTVRLTVSDGQADSVDELTLVPCRPPGDYPLGVLHITSDASLEFGGVAAGTTATKVFHVANTSEDPNSWMATCLGLGTDDPQRPTPFSIDKPRLDLRGGESADVTVTYAPTAAEHRHARLSVAASASNRSFVGFLTHGYGAPAPNAGPILAGQPAFYTEFFASSLGFGVRGIRPDGSRLTVDNGVHTCGSPTNGPGTGDFCLTDADCAANGGSCLTSALCVTGDRVGQPCQGPADCNGGFCPSYSLFDPVELCGDGAGGLYILSDEGTFTDPSPPENDNELAVSVLRIDLDAAANRVGAAIIDRTTSETAHIACDGFAAAAGGRTFITEFHQIVEPDACFRDERQGLVAIRKSGGGTQVILSRIDGAADVPECEDIDEVQRLEVSRDGSAAYAAFDLSGLWRIRPSPLQFLTESDELFRVHPDGSIVDVATTDSLTSGIVNLFRVSPNQVATNPLPPTALTPCASVRVPNNGVPDARGRTGVVSIALAPSQPGGRDATVLVNVTAGAPRIADVLPQNLFVRATLAFSAPADTTTCQFLGMVNLELLDQLTF